MQTLSTNVVFFINKYLISKDINMQSVIGSQFTIRMLVPVWWYPYLNVFFLDTINSYFFNPWSTLPLLEYSCKLMLSYFCLLFNKFTMTQVILGTCSDMSTWYNNQILKEKAILKLDYTLLVTSFTLFNFIKLDAPD